MKVDNRVGIKAAKIIGIATIIAALITGMFMIFKNGSNNKIIQTNKSGNNIFQKGGEISINTEDDPKLLINEVGEVSSNDSDLVIKYGKYNYTLTRQNQAIVFILANPSSSGIFITKNFELEILNSSPFLITYFPEGMLGLMSNYSYEVKINGFQNIYKITNDKFKYGPGDVDQFTINLESDCKMMYELKVNVEYYNIEKSKEIRRISTKNHFVGFPERIDLDSLIIDANRIDFLLYDSYALRYFLGKIIDLNGIRNGGLVDDEYTDPFYTFKRKYRLLLSPDMESKLKWGLSISKINYRIISDSIFDEVKNINGAFYKGRSQFLIIDNNMIIQQIGDHEGQILTDRDNLYKYINFFNRNFN